MNLSFLSADVGRLILRLTLGVLMLFHGAAKILHPASMDFISGMLTTNNLPGFLFYGVYIGEIVAPLMLIAGFQSRIAGLIIVINMVFAIFLAHADELFSLTQHGGLAIELQLFYLMTAAAVMFLGSGKYAFKQD